MPKPESDKDEYFMLGGASGDDITSLIVNGVDITANLSYNG